MKHVYWIVAGVFAVTFLWVAWIVQPVPQTQIIDETRYIPSEAISKDAFEQQRYRADIAEIRADLLDSQTSWFEILIAIVVGFFAILITVVVLFVTLRGEKLAIAEVKALIADEEGNLKEVIERANAATTQIEDSRDQVEELMNPFIPLTHV